MDATITAIRELDYHLEVFTNSSEVKKEIDELLSAYEENYEFSARFRSGLWDGKKRFYEFKENRFFIAKGFLELLLEKIQFTHIELLPKSYDNEELKRYFKKILESLPFRPRKYQLKAAYGFITNNHHLGIIPTGGGKSASIFITLRYFWETNKKSLLIVPTINLVDQMFSDFEDYNAPKEFLNEIKKIGGEYKDKTLDSPLIISTWQSLQKVPKSEIEKFDVLMTDEAHKLKSEVLQEINLTRVKRKYGLTGSFPINELDAMKIIQICGKPQRYVTIQELMDLGILTKTKIVALYLNYPRSITSSKMKYQEEQKFIRESQPRKNFVKNFLKTLNGVTVCLFNTTKHGEETFRSLHDPESEKISKKFDDMKKNGIFFMDGKTPSSVREQIRLYLNSPEAKNVILIAQFNVMSTGINIPKLKNLVFLSSTKSYTLVLQSIGRIMRIHKDKGETVYVYDLVDVFDYKKDNYALKHFWQRASYYKSEGHPIIEKEIDLSKFL